MKIGCVCVTENRAPVFDIAAACFAETHAHVRNFLGLSVHLFVCLPDLEDFADYQEMVSFHEIPVSWHFIKGTMPDRLHALCEVAFDSGCDLVMIWDDDDWQQWTRPIEAQRVYAEHGSPLVFGTYEGWFVNLRTLQGHRFTQDRLWGGSLVFDRVAFELGDGFKGRDVVGCDKQFLRHLGWDVATVELPLSEIVIMRGGAPRMIAFSHGANLTTHAAHVPPEEMTTSWIMNLPGTSTAAIRRAQKYLIDRRIFPPGSTE